MSKPSLPQPGAVLPPPAWSSVYAPVGGRRLLAVAATCPQCRGVTVHRLAGPAVDGILRTGACRHRYVLRAARVYAPRVGGAA